MPIRNNVVLSSKPEYQR